MNNSHKSISTNTLIVLSASFLVLFGNFAFFGHVVQVYPLSAANLAFTGSLGILLASLVCLILACTGTRHTIKPVLAVILITSAIASYFMDTYGVIIDDAMIRNTLDTNTGEFSGLLSYKLVFYVLFLGILPSRIIYRIHISRGAASSELVSRLKLIVVCIGLVALALLSFNKFYASFFREHKSLRFYANPVYYMYSIGNFIAGNFEQSEQAFASIALDANISPADVHRELVIFVVGETARSDRFSLNGYPRLTNPLLEKESVISLANMTSCATSTSISLPCMFSKNGRKDFDIERAESLENALDVLDRAGVNVLWRENNSSSKGVAVRAVYQDYRDPKMNPDCDTECRDTGMLNGLQDYIDNTATGDIFIVLHQMGSHGPEYFKRYPKAFEKFKPACESNQLEKCTREEIDNAYDNTILYTDYFLSRVIALLKANSGHFETAMLYASDHGESLGEKGIYLHGMPYMFAPDEQIRVASLLWLGDSIKQDIDVAGLTEIASSEFSHDNIFHTLLGLMEIETREYDKSLDIIGDYYY